MQRDASLQRCTGNVSGSAASAPQWSVVMERGNCGGNSISVSAASLVSSVALEMMRRRQDYCILERNFTLSFFAIPSLSVWSRVDDGRPHCSFVVRWQCAAACVDRTWTKLVLSNDS